MRYKTYELEGALLDAAVYVALGGHVSAFAPCQQTFNSSFDGNEPEYEIHLEWDETLAVMEDGMGLNLFYSTDWTDGGPLIEREKIAIFVDSTTGEWGAEMRSAAEHWIDTSIGTADGCGPTPLIAAMRAFVASKLGDDVELPTSAKLAQAPDAEPCTPLPPSPAP